MRYSDYTSDAICRAMGLPALAASTDKQAPPNGLWLRLLLKPSFDPELCITLTRHGADAEVEVRWFEEQLWLQPSLAHRPAVHLERTRSDAGAMDKVIVELERAAEEVRQQSGRWAVCDGMPIVVHLHRAVDGFEIKDNACQGSPTGGPIANLLVSLHAQVRSGSCRNAIARAAKYVDLDLPIDRSPDDRPTAHIVVLGDEAGRREAIDRLDRANKVRSERGEPD